jgi:hypothetical protein
MVLNRASGPLSGFGSTVKVLPQVTLASNWEREESELPPSSAV